MELDLHGKLWPEAQAEFIELYNHALRAPGSTPTLDIIHGYGSTGLGGVLRSRLRAYLQRQGARLQFWPGEAVDGNPGHTLVLPVQPLPPAAASLAELVWQYCGQPRTRSKITGKFRRHGDPQVLQAIRMLERQGRLRPAHRGRVTLYEAV